MTDSKYRSDYVKYCEKCNDTAFERLNEKREPTGKCSRCGTNFGDQKDLLDSLRVKNANR